MAICAVLRGRNGATFPVVTGDDHDCLTVSRCGRPIRPKTRLIYRVKEFCEEFPKVLLATLGSSQPAFQSREIGPHPDHRPDADDDQVTAQMMAVDARSRIIEIAKFQYDRINTIDWFSHHGRLIVGTA